LNKPENAQSKLNGCNSRMLCNLDASFKEDKWQIFVEVKRIKNVKQFEFMKM